jgi:hypothetical protein
VNFRSLCQQGAGVHDTSYPLEMIQQFLRSINYIMARQPAYDHIPYSFKYRHLLTMGYTTFVFCHLVMVISTRTFRSPFRYWLKA